MNPDMMNKEIIKGPGLIKILVGCEGMIYIQGSKIPIS